MSAVATREPPVERLFEPKGPTLEDRIVAAWDELIAAGHVSCPVCGSEMSRTSGCESCGSELA
jgi:hypothetical protein